MPRRNDSTRTSRFAVTLLLLFIVVAGGCQRNVKQTALEQLEEWQVAVEVRPSRIGPDRYAVDIRGTENLNAALDLVEVHCRPLIHLSCRSQKITPNQLHRIGLIEELERLDLYETPLGGGAIFLTDLKKLKALNIAGADAGDPHLADLKPVLASLESLAVGPHTTDDGLKTLADLTRLHSLFLGDAQVTGAGLVHVPTAELRSLWLDRSKFTDAHAAQLLRFPKLQRLGLSDLPITDDTVRIVGQSKTIDYVSLENTSVTDASIDVLAKMPLLYIVDTPGSLITADGVERLKQLRPDVLIGADPLPDEEGHDGQTPDQSQQDSDAAKR